MGNRLWCVSILLTGLSLLVACTPDPTSPVPSTTTTPTSTTSSTTTSTTVTPTCNPVALPASSTTPAIWSVNRAGSSGRTEVHVISGAAGGPLVQSTCTALGQTDVDWAFDSTDWNGDGISDLVAIDRTDAGSNSTAFHVLSGANPGVFLASSATVLHQTNSDWSFAVAQWNADGVPDLVAINRADAGSNSTAFFVISGANPNVYLASSGTVLHQTNAAWDFSVADWNRDGTPDIVAIDRADAGSNSTAFFVINGASPSTFIASSGTVLHQTGSEWSFDVLDWDREGTPDIVAINRTDAGSNSTALFVINGASPGSFLASGGTGLHQTNATWQFAAVGIPYAPAPGTPVSAFVAAHPVGSEIDSPWGPQCVTLIVHYLKDVYDVSITQWDASTYQPGQKSGTVMAASGWSWHQGTGDFQQGDVLVWSYTDAGLAAGHIAIWYDGQLYEQNAHANPAISLDPWHTFGTLAGYWHHN